MTTGSSLEQLESIVVGLAQEQESTKADMEQTELDWDDLPLVFDYLNKKHAIIDLNGKTVVMNMGWDPINNRLKITYSSIADFKNRYSNRTKVIGGTPPKIVKIVDFWLSSDERRQFEGICFHPSVNYEGFYNLWQGLAVKPKKGKWKKFKKFIRTVIANGNDEIAKYIIYWLADAFQNPGGPRPGTAIAMRGGQGCGKSTFAYYAGKAFGNHYLALSSGDALTGRFNLHLQNVIIVFADEAVWGGDKQAEGKLKSLITEPSIFIEPKGLNGFEVKNCVRLILASNNDWVVPAGMDERRFVVLDVSDKHSNDHEYFAGIREEMDNGGLEAMVYDLLQLDLSQVNLRQIPRTVALLDQIAASLSPFGKFWFERLRSGVLFESGNYLADNMSYSMSAKYQDNWPDIVLTSDFFNEFIYFCKQMNIGYRPTNRTAGRELAQLCPESCRKRDTKWDRKYEYHLPSLNRCRELFEKRVKMKIDWD